VARGSSADVAARPVPAMPGRLPRRSGREVQAAVYAVLRLLQKHEGGLRAEEIRARLGIPVNAMPRVLKEGLATKKLTSKGPNSSAA